MVKRRGTERERLSGRDFTRANEEMNVGRKGLGVRVTGYIHDAPHRVIDTGLLLSI